MKTRRSAGFTVIEILLVVGFVVVVVGVGYLVFRSNSDQQAQEEATSVSSAPEVQTTSDLDKADQALDQTNVDAAAADSAELDSLTTGF